MIKNILCLSLLLALQCHAGSARILCLGDSVTKGEREGVLMEDTFCFKLGAINAGIGGQSTRPGLVRLPELLATHKPRTVVIMFGLNDALNGPDGESVENYSRNLMEMIALCKKARAKVVLCTCNPLSGSFDSLNIELIPYVAAVRDIAKAKRVQIADVFQAFAEKALTVGGAGALLVDGQHPNAEGHKLILSTLRKAMAAEWRELPPQLRHAKHSPIMPD